MKIKGYSIIEVVIAMTLWSSFLLLFKQLQVNMVSKEAQYERELHHYHVIENIMYLDGLQILLKTYYSFNEKGVLDPKGSYVYRRSNQVSTIYYLDQLLYTYDTT
jgi:type II secretory pathway component PulJ